MKEYQIKDPETLSKGKLARLVDHLQYFLYWDEDSGQMFLNPEKAISGADLQQFIDELMQENGLYPKMMGPKDWSPKKRRS